MSEQGSGGPARSARPPSVDRLARELAGQSELPHPLLVDAARAAITGSGTGGSGSGGSGAGGSDPSTVAVRASELARAEERALLQPVVNATGVLLHTNLGRAPFGPDQPAAYSNVELDLGSGRRGERSTHAARLIARVCGSEDALVVNNGAAALLLVVAALSKENEVVVSRGELIEIGGGFRIPEVLAGSGAELIEVGTTNRTRLSDFASALGPRTGLLLKVHTSNYRIVGFTESVGVHELAGLARSAVAGGRQVPVVMDVGSGLLDAGCPWLPGGPPAWLAGEPAVKQVLAAGADLVTFSGDKLLGGPQAGIIAGASNLVAACRSHPLARALRPGGLVLGSLQAVMLSYLRGDAAATLPLWSMASTEVAELRRRAEALAIGDVVECESVMGGGSLPGTTIPSLGIALDGDLRSDLLEHDPPVVARVVSGHTVCDLRTVLPHQDAVLQKALLA